MRDAQRVLPSFQSRKIALEGWDTLPLRNVYDSDDVGHLGVDKKDFDGARITRNFGERSDSSFLGF